MKKTPTVPHFASDGLKNKGFALVVTVSLLVLLSVIALGFLSLSAVTLRGSTQDQAQMEARSNARLALQIAIGELQKEMGPDQRISANSSILDDPATVPNEVPNPHWTGVWDSWIAGDLADAPVDPNKYPSAGGSTHQTIGAQSPPLMSPNYRQKSRHFRRWLLSLNPDDASSLQFPINAAMEAKYMPLNDDTAVTLVGEGSLGATSPETDHVAAQLIEVQPTSDQAGGRGRYAWWVGDENQKATIMADSYRAEPPVTMAERLFRQEAPGSMGNTGITGLTGITDESQMAKVVSKDSIALLTGVDPEKSQQRFHDITTATYGVLADVREGGLKRDLSTLLERNIDPNEVYNMTYVNEFQRATSLKEGAEAYMLYNFDSLYDGRSPTGMANVPIQDLAAYYQMYDHDRPGWKGGIQFSSSQSDPPNSLLSRGFMVSTPDSGWLRTDFDRYLRQYTYPYRRPLLVKQELVLHYFAEVRDFDAEIAAWLAIPANAGKTEDQAKLALNIPGNRYNLKIGVTPSLTLWNPFNVPLVMNDWSTYPDTKVPGYTTTKEDKASLSWNGAFIHLRLNFTKRASYSGPVVQSYSRGMYHIFGSAYQPTFFTNGKFPLVFEPGESKVLSLQATSVTNPDGGATEVDFMQRGGGGRQDLEHFYDELELVPGWNPDRFLRPSMNNLGNVNNRQANLVPIFNFNESDFVGVDIVPGNWNGGLGQETPILGCISTARAHRSWPRNGPYPQMVHFRLLNFGPRTGGLNATYQNGFQYLGYPRAGRGGIASTSPRPLTVLPRKCSDFVAAMGDPNNNRDDVPQAFFYYSIKAGVETHESRNSSPPLGGSGRRFPARPFLHSETMALSSVADKLDGASLYNCGWNWFFMPLNNTLDAPISISGSNSGYFGGGYTAENGTTHLVQQQLPLTPPISIAALSNANLGGFSLATESPVNDYGFNATPDERWSRVTANGAAGLSPYTSQAIGNSYAHPNIPAGRAYTTVVRNFQEGINRTTPFVDHSYLANKALWDEYFFSSITPVPDNPVFGSSPKTVNEVAKGFFFDDEALPNRRIVPYGNNLSETKLDEMLGQYSEFTDGFADQIAAHLMVNGTFNINSTSVEAWKGLFSSLKGKPVAYLDKDTALDGGEVNLKQDTPAGVPIAAGGVPNAPSFRGSPSDPSDREQWTGWRELTPDEIEELAKAMVRQVKKRGPFLSLSEFVNRRLDSSDPELSVKGALQAALDDPSIPTNMAINGGFRNADRKFTSAEVAYVNPAFREAMEGPVAYGSSAYVDQADILRNLAEQLTPRGDTFVIRTYGDSIDASGKVQARAWCEAVVQRMPDYVDSADENHVKQADLDSEANKQYGRKFEVISFRWLDSSEI